MNKVRMFGPLQGATGYGNAVRSFALAFSKSDIPTKFNFGKIAEGRHSEFLSNLNHYNGPTNIDFYLHGPPWNKHRSNAYKIGYFYWEADRLPISWEKMINQVDELWVPCALVEKVCRKANFKGPIKIIPTPADGWSHNKKLYIPSPYNEDEQVSDEVFKFYSIFQWHERKGYSELLNSYYKTFNRRDNILLVLKTNPLKVGGYTKENIKRDILNIKRKLNQSYYPKVYICRDIISDEDIQSLHNSCDCYVAAHHGEGWGVPIHDAMISENHLIVTNFGGVTEHLDSSSSNIISHKLGPVTGMSWSHLYGKYQQWAYPSIRSLSKQMREIYSNPSAHSDKILNAKKISRKMDTLAVSKIINKELSKRRTK